MVKRYPFRISASTSDEVSIVALAKFKIVRHVDQHRSRPRKAAVDFFSLSVQARHKLVQKLLEKQVRALVASLSKEQVFGEKLKEVLLTFVPELIHQFGAVVLKANIKAALPQQDVEPMHVHQEPVFVERKQSQKPKIPKNHSLAIKESGIKKPKKAAKRKPLPLPRATRVPAPARAMPKIMETTVLETLGGSDIAWLGQKLITHSDLEKNQKRFYVPNQIDNVLTEAERSLVRQSTKEELKVVVVDHQGQTWNTGLRCWPSLKRYVFVEEWLDFAIRKGVLRDHECELWTFRKPPSDNNQGKVPETLGFAMNFPALASAAGGASGGSSAGTNTSIAPNTTVDTVLQLSEI